MVETIFLTWEIIIFVLLDKFFVHRRYTVMISKASGWIWLVSGHDRDMKTWLCIIADGSEGFLGTVVIVLKGFMRLFEFGLLLLICNAYRRLQTSVTARVKVVWNLGLSFENLTLRLSTPQPTPLTPNIPNPRS